MCFGGKEETFDDISGIFRTFCAIWQIDSQIPRQSVKKKLLKLEVWSNLRRKTHQQCLQQWCFNHGLRYCDPLEKRVQSVKRSQGGGGDLESKQSSLDSGTIHSSDRLGVNGTYVTR